MVVIDVQIAAGSTERDTRVEKKPGTAYCGSRAGRSFDGSIRSRMASMFEDEAEYLRSKLPEPAKRYYNAD